MKFIFPIKTTCIKTQWSDLEQTEFIAKVIQSYTSIVNKVTWNKK